MLLRGATGLFFLMLAGGAVAGPIHDAAYAGYVAEVDRLIAAGTSVEETNQLGETALIVAARAGRYGLVEKLALTYKANIKARDSHGMTALHAAAIPGDFKTVALLAAMGVNLNDAENDRGVSVLMLAVEQNNVMFARLLVDHYARIEQADARGFTPLTIAGQHGFEEMTLLLIRFGASCQKIDPHWYARCTEKMISMGLTPR